MSVPFGKRRRFEIVLELLEGRVALSTMPSAAQYPAALDAIGPNPVVVRPVVAKPVAPIQFQADKPVQKDPLDLVVPILQNPPNTVAIPAKPAPLPGPIR